MASRDVAVMAVVKPVDIWPVLSGLVVAIPAAVAVVGVEPWRVEAVIVLPANDVVTFPAAAGAMADPVAMWRAAYTSAAVAGAAAKKFMPWDRGEGAVPAVIAATVAAESEGRELALRHEEGAIIPSIADVQGIAEIKPILEVF